MLFAVSCKMRMKHAEIELQRHNFFNAHTFATQHKKSPYTIFSNWLLAELYMQPQSPYFNTDSAYFYAQGAWHLSQQQVSWKRYPTELNLKIERQRQLVLNFRKNQTLAKPSHKVFKTWQSADEFIYDSLRNAMQIAYEQWMLDSIYRTQNIEQLEHFKTHYFLSVWMHDINDTLDIWQSKKLLTGKEGTEHLLHYAEKHPKSRYFNVILDSAFNTIVKDRDTLNTERFIRLCNSEFWAQKAWHELYKQYWFFYQKQAPQRFLNRYPKAPQLEDILNDVNSEQRQLYPLKSEDSTGQNLSNYGFIDSTGQWIIKAQYDYADAFYNQRAIVAKGDSLIYITPSGHIINDNMFEEAYPFINAITYARKHNQWYKLFLSGHYELMQVDEVIKPDIYGTLFVKDGKYGLLNKNGQLRITPEYDKIHPFSYGFANAVYKNQKGLLDTLGQFKPFNADWISPVQSNGQFIYKYDTLFGIADTGMHVLGAGFQYIAQLDEKTYVVVHQNRYGYLDYSGCFIKFPEPDYSAMLPTIQYGNNNFLRWEQDHLPVFINAHGFNEYSIPYPKNFKDVPDHVEILIPYWIVFKTPTGYDILNLKSALRYTTEGLPERVLNTCFQYYTQGFYQLIGTKTPVTQSLYPYKTLDKNHFLGMYDSGYALFNAEGKCLAQALKSVKRLTNSTLILVYNNMKVVLLNAP